MKNLLKLSFSALAIAVCLTNCTKDNSNKPSASVKSSSGFKQTNMALRDTITPGPGGGKGGSSKLATPQVSRDTITPGPDGGKGGGKG